MDFGNIEEDKIDNLRVKDMMEKLATFWFRGEFKMDEGSDEIFPSWCALISTKSISDGIDWVTVDSRVKSELRLITIAKGQSST